MCGNEVPQKSLLLQIQMDGFEEWSCEIHLIFNDLLSPPWTVFCRIRIVRSPFMDVPSKLLSTWPYFAKFWVAAYFNVLEREDFVSFLNVYVYNKLSFDLIEISIWRYLKKCSFVVKYNESIQLRLSLNNKVSLKTLLGRNYDYQVR